MPEIDQSPPGGQSLVRALKKDELAFYRANGWVKVEALIAPDVAAAMLKIARPIVQTPDIADKERRSPKVDDWGSRVVDSGYWRDYHFIARDDRREPFRAIAFSEQIGRNSQQLMGRNVAVRFNTDFLAVKVPGPTDGPANRPTAPHQDFVNVPFDRIGNHNYWIALDDVTAEQGALRFYSGSHRLGPLGLHDDDHETVLASYAELMEAEGVRLSDPVELKPGDATIHSSMTIHCAPPNTTERWRVGYVLAYMPADSRYTGAPYYNVENTGMKMGDVFDHARFPIIYPTAPARAI
ncbi:MAG TPA: phytanoyl-CoA dioxygenase family protein [Caulobacterales bacterium]|nr:phytanoyl-CoA dioxygenase family protein [Caulobacterales bacterium]